MQYGFCLPNTMDGDELCRFAQKAEELEFESVWIGDHIVLPTAPTNQYPYTDDGSFRRPHDAPFLETLTILAYVAACTSTIRIGSTVVIVPYRNPILQAKIFASLDVLSKGRAVCGVGVGWLEKEFETLDVPYSERGPMTNEWLEIFTNLWTEQEPAYSGDYYSYDGIFFEPKPVQQPRIPIWVGGHTRRALRRTAKYGDAWHPSRQTPEYVTRNLPYLYQQVEAEGRSPDDITISLKRSLHISDIGVSGSGSGNENAGAGISARTQTVIDDIKKCADIGIHQLTYDFPTNDIEECIRILEHFAEKVAPAAS